MPTRERRRRPPGGYERGATASAPAGGTGPVDARAVVAERFAGRRIVSLHSGLPISVVDLAKARPPFRIAVAPSGAAYVFTRSGDTWSQQAYLKASSVGGSDFFGTSVEVDGDLAIVGAYAEDGYRSVADVVDAESLAKVRATKQEIKKTLDEIVNKGGEKIHPEEIERYLLAHDAVVEAARSAP